MLMSSLPHTNSFITTIYFSKVPSTFTESTLAKNKTQILFIVYRSKKKDKGLYYSVLSAIMEIYTRSTVET